MRDHWWSINYSVFKVGGSATLYFKKRGDAERFARRQVRSGGSGDWVVWRHGPFNYAKKILTVGGFFDDWPDYDPDEDY